MNVKSVRHYGFTSFCDNSLEAISYAAEHNLNYVEINFSQKHTPQNSFSGKQLNEIRNFAIRHNIKLSFHIPFTENISDIIPTIRRSSIQRLSKFIEVAGKIGAQTITVHPGIFYWFPYVNIQRKKALDRLLKALNILARVCETNKVKIVLENLVPIPEGSDFFFLGDNIEDFKYIFEHIQFDLIGFCLDTGHANMAEGAEEYIKSLGDKICVIHYHDNHGNNDNHLCIGEGSIKWKSVCGNLLEINFNGPFISECRGIEPYEAARLFENEFHSIKTLDSLPGKFSA
jgi:sugar phosphate isomerase/epimerase